MSESFKHKVFRNKDTVSYGAMRGVLIGIFDQDQCLFFSDEAKECLLTCSQILNFDKKISNVILFMLHEYFGEPEVALQEMLYKQSRFKIVSLGELKHAVPLAETIHQGLLRKRHIYLTVARSYMKHRSANDARIHRLCEKAEEIQLEIESREEQTRHLSGFASYE